MEKSKGGKTTTHLERKRSNVSPSESEEDPEELLAKLTTKQKTCLNAEGKPALQFNGKPSPRVNGIFMANPLKNGEFLLFGGERFDGKSKCEFYGDTFTYSLASNAWNQLDTTVSPSPRSAHQAVILPNKKELLMFGGEFGTSKETKFLHFSDTWIFNFENYSWRALKSKIHPSSRSGHRMVTIGDYVFLFGGFFDTGDQSRYLDDLWIFDPKELCWIKVDWMNEYESRPSARSGFSLLPHPKGAILYGGYAQVREKNGSIRGQVFNDLWLLYLDQIDIKTTRWKKLKLSRDAPPPRSGSSSTPHSNGFINFGGVIDEEISDEFLIGECINDLYRYDFSSKDWSKLQVSNFSGNDFDPAAFCGRFNAMISYLESQQLIIIYGGIFEVGDRQFTLDDLYSFDLSNGNLTQLQALSLEMIGCWNLIKAESTDDSSSGSGDDNDDGSSSSSSNDSSGEESSSEDDTPTTKLDKTGRPIASSYTLMKEFFDDNIDYWMGVARQENFKGEVNDKKLRSTAFAIAKQVWEEQYQLEMNINLN